MTDKLRQLETKMIEDEEGCHAVCIDKTSRFNGWLFFKHPDGRWVTKRLALPMEILRAQRKLEHLEAEAGVPQKG